MNNLTEWNLNEALWIQLNNAGIEFVRKWSGDANELDRRLLEKVVLGARKGAYVKFTFPLFMKVFGQVEGIIGHYMSMKCFVEVWDRENLQIAGFHLFEDLKPEGK